MNWIDRPDSSVISRFCYDAERCVLVIEFKHGGVYGLLRRTGDCLRRNERCFVRRRVL
jgi:hypothetical protein